MSAFLDVGDDDAVGVAQRAVADACAAEGIELAGWRPVPVDETHLGAAARVDQPSLWHGILQRPDDVDDVDAERRAYRARRRAEAICREARVRHYFASFSFVTVTYKALVLSDRLAAFYPDLADDEFERVAGDLPQPLLDEHHSGVGARAAVPSPVPQRRDQHRARQ